MFFFPQFIQSKARIFQMELKLENWQENLEIADKEHQSLNKQFCEKQSLLGIEMRTRNETKSLFSVLDVDLSNMKELWGNELFCESDFEAMGLLAPFINVYNITEPLCAESVLTCEKI